MKPDIPDAAARIDLTALTGREPVKRIAGRNSTKADLLFYRLDGQGIALKTYAARGVISKWLVGRRMIRHEAEAYKVARNVSGLPKFLGCLGSTALATEWILAPSLAEKQGAEVSAEVFDRIDAIVSALHQQGVAMADLHRGDILVGESGEVYLIDLAASWLLGKRPSRWRRRIFVHMCNLDRIAIARIRAQWTGGDVDAAVWDVGGPTAKWHARGRRLKRVWNRIRRRNATR